MYVGSLSERYDHLIFRLENTNSKPQIETHDRQIPLSESNDAMMLIYCTKQKIKSVVINMKFARNEIKIDLKKSSFLPFEEEENLKNHFYETTEKFPYVAIPWMVENFNLIDELYLDFPGTYYIPSIQVN